MTLDEQTKLQQQAQEFWLAAKNHLLQTLQPGNRRVFGGGTTRANDRGAPSPYMQKQPGMSFQSGRTPSDTDVSNYINKVMGGNPYEKALKQAGAQAPTPAATVPASRGYGGGFGTPGAAAAQATPQSNPNQLFERMMLSAQAKMDEANAANIARYDEGKGELGDLRGRNQDRATNWGIAAQADIDERMKNALLDSEASLAARGLGGSTIQDSFRMAEAQKTAREQQRVSEMRDSRASDYDTRDTGALVNFIERRNDVGPDPIQLQQMALQYGLANQQALEREKAAEAMKLALAQQNSGTGGQTIPPRALVRSGPQGGASVNWMGANPIEMAQAYFGGGPRMMQGPAQATQQQAGPAQQAPQVQSAGFGTYSPATLPIYAAKYVAPALKKAAPKLKRKAKTALNIGGSLLEANLKQATTPEHKAAAQSAIDWMRRQSRKLS